MHWPLGHNLNLTASQLALIFNRKRVRRGVRSHARVPFYSCRLPTPRWLLESRVESLGCHEQHHLLLKMSDVTDRRIALMIENGSPGDLEEPNNGASWPKKTIAYNRASVTQALARPVGFDKFWQAAI